MKVQKLFTSIIILAFLLSGLTTQSHVYAAGSVSLTTIGSAYTEISIPWQVPAHPALFPMAGIFWKQGRMPIQPIRQGQAQVTLVIPTVSVLLQVLSAHSGDCKVVH